MEDKKLNDEMLISFIERLDQNTYGPGGVYVSVEDYLSTISSLKQLIDLVTQAIQNAEHNEELDASASKLLWEFRDNLITFLHEINK
jgi:hypothetical protein